MLYFRFVICLGVGLFGLALLMSTVMDAVLVDWDVSADLRDFINRLSKRDKRRYVLIGEGQGQIRVNKDTNSAEKQRAREFLAPVLPSELKIPAPPPAGPRLKRLDIFAPEA